MRPIPYALPVRAFRQDTAKLARCTVRQTGIGTRTATGATALGRAAMLRCLQICRIAVLTTGTPPRPGSGQYIQHVYHSRGCSSGVCYDSTSWQNYTNHCDDGVKDCDETGRDSGGSCSDYGPCGTCCAVGSTSCYLSCSMIDVNALGGTVTDCWTDGWATYVDYRKNGRIYDVKGTSDCYCGF